MNARELSAGVRPLESAAKAVLRFAEIAHEAIRLEEGLAVSQRRLIELTGQATVAQAEVTALTAEAATLAATLDAQRKAAVEATKVEQHAIIVAARAVVERHERAAAEWEQKAAAARAQHDAVVTTLKSEEAELRAHVNGLKDLAQRMARAAEAVPR